MYAIPDEIQDQLMPVFIIINPFKIGPWIMGIAFVLVFGAEAGQV